MSVTDDLVEANARYAAAFTGAPPAAPGRHVVVVTCMDARIDPMAVLGLAVGDAHVLRNAGGLPTDDVLRSLAISQRHLGTREVVLVHHTGCGMQGFDDAAFRAELAATGEEPGWDVPGFADPAARMRASLARVRECPWLPHRDAVRGFVYDVATGRLHEVP